MTLTPEGRTTTAAPTTDLTTTDPTPRRHVWVVCERHSGLSGTQYIPCGTLRQAAHRSRENALDEARRHGAFSSSDLKVRRRVVDQTIWEECQP